MHARLHAELNPTYVPPASSKLEGHRTFAESTLRVRKMYKRVES